MKQKQVIRKRINKRFIPNAFTVLNMYLGFSAIILLISGDPLKAAWFVFAAAMLDAFDGKLARILGIESTFGTEFDSFADTVSFCVTPSILIYTTWSSGLNPILAVIFSFIPILFGTIRLAKFNLIKDETSSNFTGLTTPLFANLLFGYVLFSNQVFGNYGDPRLAFLMTTIFGLLMFSQIKLGRIPYLSLKKGKMNNIRLISGFAIFASIIIWKGLVMFPIFLIYVTWSVFNWLFHLDKIALLKKFKPSHYRN